MDPFCAEQDKFQKPEKGKKKGKNKAETKGSNLNSDPQTSSERDSALQDKVRLEYGGYRFILPFGTRRPLYPTN